MNSNVSNMIKKISLRRLSVIFLLITAVSLSFFFQGCGPKKRQPQYTADGKLKIVFWHSMAGPLGDVLNKMIDEFNKTNKDNVFVKSEFIGEYGTLNQKIAAAVFAEIPPHISQVYETWTLQLKNEKAVVNLDKFIDSKEVGIDKNDIVPALLKNVTIDGSVYSMPFNKSIPVLYYNKHLFKCAGLDPDKSPATWDEYNEYGKKLTMVEMKKGFFFSEYMNREEYEKVNGAGSFPPKGKTVIWGTAFMPDPWSFENLIVQNGGKIISDNGKKSLINSPEAVEAASQLVGKIITHKFGIRTSGREHQNEFISGRVGMIEGTIVSKVFIQKDVKFPFGMELLPGRKFHTSVLSGTNVAIYSGFTPEEELAAWKFIKWFTDTERTAHWGVKTTYMPVRKSAYNTDLVKETIKKDPNMKVALTMLDGIEFEPQVASWFECRGILSKATEAIVSTTDLKNIKGILDKAAAEMDQVLSEEE